MGWGMLRMDKCLGNGFIKCGKRLKKSETADGREKDGINHLVKNNKTVETPHQG